MKRDSEGYTLVGKPPSGALGKPEGEGTWVTPQGHVVAISVELS